MMVFITEAELGTERMQSGYSAIFLRFGADSDIELFLKTGAGFEYF